MATADSLIHEKHASPPARTLNRRPLKCPGRPETSTERQLAGWSKVRLELESLKPQPERATVPFPSQTG